MALMADEAASLIDSRLRVSNHRGGCGRCTKGMHISLPEL
jgi:hypothetical protein